MSGAKTLPVRDQRETLRLPEGNGRRDRKVQSLLLRPVRGTAPGGGQGTQEPEGLKGSTQADRDQQGRQGLA